jgi:sortase (surface protein transpeptidase)
VIRRGAVLLLLVAACSADPGSGAGGSAVSARTISVRAVGPAVSAPTNVPINARPSAGPVPQSRGLALMTTSTIPWASVRLDDEKPVEPPVPVRIEIVALDLEAPILPLGVESATGQMEVPENVDDVGWYRFGSAPGWPGSAVLAAHVDMAGEGPGVFFHLDRLRMGDRINVDFDDGTTSTFVVSHAERIPKGELNFDSVFSPVGQPLLRLVTCGGTFNRTIRSYDDNLVVTAQPLRP